MIDFNAETISFYTDLGIDSIYIFCSKELLADYMQIFKGWNFTPLVWCKTNPVPFCASSYLPDIEYLLYFSRKGRIWNKGLKPMTMYSRFYLSPKEEGKQEAGDIHPTIKPLQLARDKITISTTPGGIVFDGFGGSGTTLIAAEQTGRICYMMEQDEDYCLKIIERWERLTGMKAYEC